MTRRTVRTKTRQKRRGVATSAISSSSSYSLLTRHAKQFIPVLVLFAGLYAYHASLYGPFVFDDLPAIEANPTIRRLWPLWSIVSTPPHSAVTGRPITNLYAEAVRIDPNDADAHYNLGLALVREGKTQDAIRHLETTLKLNPGFQRARRALRDLTSSGAE